MELALALRELSACKRLVALGALLAAILATLSVYRLDGTTLKPRGLVHASASTQVFVDTPSTVLGNLEPALPPVLTRAQLFASFMASPGVLQLIAKQVGLSGDQIYATGPVDPQQPRAVVEPTALQRNVQITGETIPYRLNFTNDPNLPIIGIYAQAPTPKLAIGLAQASVAGLQQYVSALQASQNVPRSSRVVIRELGQPNGGVVNAGIKKSLAALVFFAVFLLWNVLLLVAARFRKTWRASQDVFLTFEPASANGHTTGNGHSDDASAPRDALRRVLLQKATPARSEEPNGHAHDTADGFDSNSDVASDPVHGLVQASDEVRLASNPPRSGRSES